MWFKYTGLAGCEANTLVPEGVAARLPGKLLVCNILVFGVKQGTLPACQTNRLGCDGQKRMTLPACLPTCLPPALQARASLNVLLFACLTAHTLPPRLVMQVTARSWRKLKARTRTKCVTICPPNCPHTAPPLPLPGYAGQSQELAQAQGVAALLRQAFLAADDRITAEEGCTATAVLAWRDAEGSVCLQVRAAVLSCQCFLVVFFGLRRRRAVPPQRCCSP